MSHTFNPLFTSGLPAHYSRWKCLRARYFNAPPHYSGDNCLLAGTVGL